MYASLSGKLFIMNFYLNRYNAIETRRVSLSLSFLHITHTHRALIMSEENEQERVPRPSGTRALSQACSPGNAGSHLRPGGHEGPGPRCPPTETERLQGATEKPQVSLRPRPPAGTTPGNPPWSRQSDQERIKGTAAGEGLRTRERRFAVDPHGLQVHGSHQAPTCWVRTGCRP